MTARTKGTVCPHQCPALTARSALAAPWPLSLPPPHGDSEGGDGPTAALEMRSGRQGRLLAPQVSRRHTTGICDHCDIEQGERSSTCQSPAQTLLPCDRSARHRRLRAASRGAARGCAQCHPDLLCPLPRGNREADARCGRGQAGPQSRGDGGVDEQVEVLVSAVDEPGELTVKGQYVVRRVKVGGAVPAAPEPEVTELD